MSKYIRRETDSVLNSDDKMHSAINESDSGNDIFISKNRLRLRVSSNDKSIENCLKDF